jgi:hypothetical protein
MKVRISQRGQNAFLAVICNEDVEVYLLRGARRTTRPMNKPALTPYSDTLTEFSRPVMTTTRNSSRGVTVISLSTWNSLCSHVLS